MKSIVFLVLLTQAACLAQPRLEMPMLGAPLPQTKFELMSKISPAKLARLPARLPNYKWSSHPRDFPVAALQTLLDESAFAGTNLLTLLASASNQNGAIRLGSRDNQDYFIVMPAAGRIAVQNTDRSREYPPADAVPDFDATWKRALHFSEMLGVTTNELERNLDGSVHIRKTENTTSHLGGSVKYKSRRAVAVSRSIGGYLVRSLDEDKIELELGVNGRLLRFNFKWPNIQPSSTNNVLPLEQIMARIKQGAVLADPSNEYPPGGIAQIELKDYQVFYYVATMLPYGRRGVTLSKPDIEPMIEFLAVFKSSNGANTEGGLFARITESP